MKALATVAMLLLAGCATTPTLADAPKISTKPIDDRTVQIIVSPHEDDEWQDWAHVEHRADTYKVFVVLGRGEQTSFCLAGQTVGLQADKGELPPTPTPTGQWTSSCSDARLASWLGFFGDMSIADPTLPGDFADPVTTIEFPDNGVGVCRHDSPLNSDGVSVGGCTSTNRTATVWTDVQGRGTLIAWDLGEGDQTPEEIAWAIGNIVDHPTEFGIPALPVAELWGGYANVDNPDCFQYANVDHVALHAALRAVRFDVPVQGAATCSTSPDAHVHVQVSESSMVAAFEVTADGQRVGAHPRWYGWLHESWYHLSPDHPGELFHGSQAFWMLGIEP